MPYVRTRLGRWFYEERGAGRGGEAILLWHGLLFDGGMWRHQMAPLAALGRVVAFDGPGHGKSETPPIFTLEDNADALVDALEELRIDRAVMVGLSWGGMLAMRLALRHPRRVKGLALLDTSADAEHRLEQAKYRVLVAFGRRFGMPRAAIDSQVVPLMFGAHTRAQQPELVERTVRAANGFPREGTARASLAVIVERADISGELRNIRVPTLVVCGTEDRATPPVHSERIAERIPGARLVWISGSGHMSALEKPREVNAELVPFVESALAAPAAAR